LGLYQPDRSETWRDTLALQLRIDAQAGPNRTLFFGDSHVAGLDVAGIAPGALNFGIGGDTIRSLTYRLRFYETVKTASAIALAIGFNEISVASPQRAAEMFGGLLDRIGPDQISRARVCICSVFPVDLAVQPALAKFGHDMNERIADFNQRIEALAVSQHLPFVQSFPPGASLPSSLHGGDGVHLNAAGYKLWAARLRECALLRTPA
ncbi:MAG: lipolytic protein family, partial [Rhodospirillales bacterium]|nr:lipolytic protein family [Rhodospirillales bacterium]